MYVIFFALIWVYATSFAFGSKLNLSRFMTGGSASKGKSSKGYNILFTSSMKRTFCDANKVRLRIIDRKILRFEFCFSFWVLIRLITFLRGGRKSIEGKNISHHLSARKEKEEPSMNSRENTCKTLIIYQISQNKSIAYEDKDDTKKT